MNNEQFIKNQNELKEALLNQQTAFILIQEWRNKLTSELSGFDFGSTSEIVDFIYQHYHITPREGNYQIRFEQIKLEVQNNQHAEILQQAPEFQAPTPETETQDQPQES